MLGVIDSRAARRLIVALVALGASAVFFHAQMSDALVTRGDELLLRGRTGAALVHYRRALSWDDGNETALDRLLFVAFELRDPAGMRFGLELASRYLKTHPFDTALRMDRAMVRRLDGDLTGAMNDFAEVGSRTGDVRAFDLAAHAAEKLGNARRARELWRAALRLHSGFAPARRALSRLAAR